MRSSSDDVEPVQHGVEAEEEPALGDEAPDRLGDRVRLDRRRAIPPLSRRLETTTTMEPPGSASLSRVSVCLVAPDGTLVQTTRPASAPPTPAEALASVSRPLEPAEIGAGLSTALSADAQPTTAVAGGLATVTLPAGFLEASASDQLAAVAQIVCTLTAQPGVGQVGFEIDGSVIEVPRGDGSTTSDPVSRQDYAATMPR